MEELHSIFASVIQNHVNGEAFGWLTEHAKEVKSESTAKSLNKAFAKIPSITGKKMLTLNESQTKAIRDTGKEVWVNGWTIDRLARVWLLMQVDASGKDAYLRKIENLFSGAEMNELVALYSSLPLLAYPESWTWRCTEGIRSNIGSVLEAIMYENSFPFFYLDEPAWNQMVLKAFFTDKQVDRIIGLDQRSNALLAAVLVDYAHERWAAQRPVNIQLWRLVGKFIDESNFSAIETLDKGNPAEKKAAALACAQSQFAWCKKYLKKDPVLAKEIAEKKISWQTLVNEIKP